MYGNKVKREKSKICIKKIPITQTTIYNVTIKSFDYICLNVQSGLKLVGIVARIVL